MAADSILFIYFYHSRNTLTAKDLCLLQPLVFGAMIHRDEAFEAIFTQYMKIVTSKPPASAEL